MDFNDVPPFEGIGHDENGISWFDCCDYDKYYKERRRISTWSFRCLAEASSYAQNCVLTLTYDNEHLSKNGSLCLADFQKFIKRLRKRIDPIKVRYFGCGEYGSKGMRPHYHVILFGWCPDDLVYSHSSCPDVKFYRSRFISDVWHNGFVVVCPTVKPKVIPYVCKYLQKFNNIPDGLVRPFTVMSRRPGIGLCALGKSVDLNTDKIYINGKSSSIPRYYLDKLEQLEIMTSMYEDSDGSLEFVPVSIPLDELKTFAVLAGIHTRVQSIRDRRASFWKNRFDNQKYINNVKKFKKFSTERDKPRR